MVKPERPKLAPFFKKLPKGWITFEPMHWALLGGFFFGVVALMIYSICYLLGMDLNPHRVIIRIALSFVLGYGLSGVFIWYLLFVVQREIPEEQESFVKKKVEFDSKKAKEQESDLPEVEIPLGEMPESEFPPDMSEAAVGNLASERIHQEEISPEHNPGVEE